MARLVWSVAEGLGRRYVPGTSTDVGAAVVYSFMFGAFLVVHAGRLSADVWTRLAEHRRPRPL